MDGTDRWVLNINSQEPRYQIDNLRENKLCSGDSDNMHRFCTKFPKPNTKCDQHVSMRLLFRLDGIEYEDAVSFYLYCGKIVYGWVWEQVPIGLGHPVDRVVYNVRDLTSIFPDAVAFLRQEGILEKTWLQKIMSLCRSISTRP